jgi:hypothetical protein
MQNTKVPAAQTTGTFHFLLLTFYVPLFTSHSTYFTFGPASITSCGVPSVNLAKFSMKRWARSL